jgi:tetratricopeptide (TPR) repeat protein
VYTNGYQSQVVANETTSTVTFSILSPGASLSCDRIKLRLDEYRTLLASDSDTIEISTEYGKTIICRKQANEMEKYLDQAGILLQDVVQSRDISTLVVLHRLRDLAMVLDKLKLDDECRLTGDCALDLAEALVRHSPEFKEEQADALVFIAELSVYQPRARALFIQAVSISEEMVENNASHSNPNKCRIVEVLGRAGSWALLHPDHPDHPDHSDHLGAQWLGRAVQLFTKVLPPITVNTRLISNLYINYGVTLLQREQYSNALEAYYESLSHCRILVSIDPAAHNDALARALYGVGTALCEIGKYDDAIVAFKEALEICTIISAQDPLQHNELMASVLVSYGTTLGKLKRVPEAAAVQQQAISFLRNLTQSDVYRYLLSQALHLYGNDCASLGQHAEAVLAFQESILLQRAIIATHFAQGTRLEGSFHDIAISFNALDKHAEADAAATEALEGNHGWLFEDCQYAPDYRACFVCQRASILDSLDSLDSLLNVSPQSVSPPLPAFQTNSFRRPAEHPGADDSLTLAETSTNTTSADIPPTIWHTYWYLVSLKSYLKLLFLFTVIPLPHFLHIYLSTNHIYPTTHWRDCGDIST